VWRGIKFQMAALRLRSTRLMRRLAFRIASALGVNDLPAIGGVACVRAA